MVSAALCHVANVATEEKRAKCYGIYHFKKTHTLA